MIPSFIHLYYMVFYAFARSYLYRVGHKNVIIQCVTQKIGMMKWKEEAHFSSSLLYKLSNLSLGGGRSPPLASAAGENFFWGLGGKAPQSFKKIEKIEELNILKGDPKV